MFHNGSRELARSWSRVKPGYYPAMHFSDPKLGKAHPDDLLYFIVPRNYHPERASGRVIFMHGGGTGSPCTSPAHSLRPDRPTIAR